jgi:predicted ribosome quality control (RQC) complex YloA/Tae2 family protein
VKLKNLEITGSHLEFIVEGTDRVVHYGDTVPFLKKTEDWKEAQSWIKKLSELPDGDPHLTIIEVMTVKGLIEPVRLTLFSGYVSRYPTARNVEKIANKIVALQKEIKELKKRLQEIPAEIENYKKELDQLIELNQSIIVALQKKIKEWEKRLQEIPAEIKNYKKELDQLIELNKSLKETFARFGLEFQL